MAKVAWWQADRDDVAAILGVAGRVWQAHEQNLANYKQAWAIYGDSLAGWEGVAKRSAVFEEQIAENQAANTIDTLHAMVFRNKIMPAASTTGGTIEEQERARSTGRFLKGVFEDNDVHDVAVPEAGMDALIVGTGIFHVSHEREGDEARIVVQRQNPMDFALDPREYRSGKPRTFFRRVAVDRYDLLEQIEAMPRSVLQGTRAKRREAILDYTSTPTSGEPNASVEDQVYVYEAWRLASGDEPGRHAIYIPDMVLVSEDWLRKEPPFVFIRMGFQAAGVLGASAMERIAPMQRCLDRLAARVQEAHDLIGMPKLLVPLGSRIEKMHLDDQVGSIIAYEAKEPPKEWNPVPITPDAYRERDSLPVRMRALLGVSQFEASQQLPQQLREASGAAIERWEDSSTSRHAMLHRRYEMAVKHLARQILVEAAYVTDLGMKVSVAAPAEHGVLEDVSWEQCIRDIRSVRLSILPISQLPATFSGKVSALGRMYQDKVISLAQYQRLLEIGDVEGETDLATAPLTLIRRTLAKMVRDGVYYEPLPTDDLQMCQHEALLFLAQYRISADADDERVGLIHRYVSDAQALMSGNLHQGPQMPPGAPPGAPLQPMAGAPAPAPMPVMG